METPLAAPAFPNLLTDTTGLRLRHFPREREPSVRTLPEGTKLRRIPHPKVGHFVYYDPAEVAEHIRTKLKFRAEARCVRRSHAEIQRAFFLAMMVTRAGVVRFSTLASGR